MSLNINNPMEFQQQFDNLKEMVNQLASSDEKENSEIREKINAQISLLASTAICPNSFKEPLKEFQKKITSTFTAEERNKLLKDLEKIHELIIPKSSSSSSSSSSVEEESKLVPKKATMGGLPKTVLLQILEFAFSTKANLSAVSSPWKDLMEDSRFWNMAIKEFGMFGIDPSKPPREAFIERIEEDVKVYEELFPEIPKNLSPLEKYRYCKNSEKFKKIISEATGLDFDSPNLQNPLSFPHALLDLNLPLSHNMFHDLGNYPPEIQKELVKRVVAKEGDRLGESGIDLYILGQLINCQEKLRKILNVELEKINLDLSKLSQDEVNKLILEMLPPDQIDEIVQRANSAIILIDAKRKEFKKFYNEPKPNPVRILGMMTYPLSCHVRCYPIIKTLFDIFLDVPVDWIAARKMYAEAKKLGLTDTV